MGKKIGRNDRCTCGSGKKYKRCCLPKEQGSTDSWGNKLRESNPAALYSAIAALQLDPRNQGQHIRLDEALVRIGRLGCTGNKPADISLLLDWLNNSPDFEDAKSGEDPPEGLFTENVAFHGGNYIVYPGTQEGPTFILGCLFGSLSSGRSDLPEELRELLVNTALAVLSVSNRIARTLGHARWMTYPQEEAEFEVQATPGVFYQAQAAVTFTHDELVKVCRRVNADPSLLSPFIFSIDDPHLKKPLSFYESPFHLRPIVSAGDRLIVADPSGLLSALRHFFILTAQKHGILEKLVAQTREVLWDHLLSAMRLLDFDRTDINSSLQSENIRSEIFSFDSDKLCILLLISDSARNYDANHAFGRFDTTDAVKLYETTINQVATDIRSRAEYKDAQILILLTHFGFGRDAFFGFNVVPTASRFVGMSAHDLVTLAYQRKFDAVTLWNYSVAEDDLESKGIKLQRIGFFDGFRLFQRHSESFYVDDERVYTFIMAPTDGARPFREKEAALNDYHNVVVPGGMHLETVIRMQGDTSNIPIYVPTAAFGQRLLMVVEGYQMPIWVTPAVTAPDGHRSDYFHVCDSIAYWLWQLTPELKPHLEQLGTKPFLVQFDFLETGEQSPANEVAFQWTYDTEARTFALKFPHDFDNKNIRKDNWAERFLVRAMVEMFNEALRPATGNSLPNTEIDRIVDAVAPLGLKKKLLSIDVGLIPALHPGTNAKLRKLRKYNLEKNLEDLGLFVKDSLRAHRIEVGEVPPQLRKEAMDAIKARYLQRLLDSIAPFDKESLLVLLVDANETVTREREYARITNATAVACYYSVEEKAKQLAEELPTMNGTAIGLRFLIEVVTATKLSGTKKVSNTDFDNLVSLAYGYVNWGMLGEEIRCRVTDHRLSILPTGRIGIDKTRRGSFEDYVLVKSAEGLEREIRSYTKSASEEKEDASLFEAAFQAEYGISFEEFRLGVQGLIQRPLDAGDSAVAESADTLKAALVWEGLKAESAATVLEMLSLNERDSWNQVPPGCTQADIDPWRFSRKASLMSRPLISLRNGKIIYGPRHLSVAASTLLKGMMTGDIRAEFFSSSEMKSYIAVQTNRKGKLFEAEFHRFATKSGKYQVEKSVDIGPNGILKHPEDLGDVDSFIFDLDNRRALVVECKDIDPGRTPVEMGQEIDRFVKDEGNKKSRMRIHSERCAWLATNWSRVKSKFKLPDGQWSLIPVFVTSEELPAPRLRELPTSVRALTALEKDGLDSLWKLSPKEWLKTE